MVHLHTQWRQGRLKIQEGSNQNQQIIYEEKVYDRLLGSIWENIQRILQCSNAQDIKDFRYSYR